MLDVKQIDNYKGYIIKQIIVQGGSYWFVDIKNEVSALALNKSSAQKIIDDYELKKAATKKRKERAKPTEFKFHIVCLQPEKLKDYGFIKNECGYKYRTATGRHEIAVWNEKARNRIKNKMTFPCGTPKFTVELACLFANLLKDGIIEFTKETPLDIKKRQIEKLELEIKRLKEELL